MKLKLTLIVCLFLAAAMLMTSCEANLDDLLALIGGSTTTTNPDNLPPVEDEWDELYDIITIAEAIEIAQGASEPTAEKYYIRGTITTVSNAMYGEMYIKDETGEIYVYGVVDYSTMSDKPVKGDEVLLYGSLQNYKGEKLEVCKCDLIDFRRADPDDIDESQYTEMSIDEARETAEGTKVKVSGVVARITFANGLKPSGVYLVDGTNSIYVYDGDLAQSVSIGNKITVLASKTYWVLESEQSAAEKHGYKGCCQLESATLVSNDNKTDNEFDKSWIEETTVKELLNTPVTENVTTTIFKVNALVKKAEGKGFTNYYFYDLDGKTGAYTYTQCNGSDFAWLDEFDGKICTVYLSVINAKSTSTECFFRLLPVAVVDEGFEFDLTKTPEHLVEYYGKDQFLYEYTGDPQAELVTSVSSELLGFENATLSYASSNESVVYFETVDGKTVFHCGENGTATVTVTATYGELTASVELDITVSIAQEIPSVTVGEAIEANEGEIVTVKGVVGPSLVNQTGFYLIDETGMIAVRVTADAFEGLAIGQTIIVKGTRFITKDGGGQICIDNAEIIANYYGNVDYATDSFVTDMTFDDVINTPDSPEATTQVYVVTATVKLVESNFYANIYLTNGSTDFILYCSNASQYAFLKSFAGEEVTVELALCDWNAKGLKGCVLSVITEDGQVFNEFNFLK